MSGYFYGFSFFLGSIPFSLLVSRIFKVKNLTQQEGEITGETQVSQEVGFWPAGFITFLLDLSKGILAVLLCSPIGLNFLQFLLGGKSELETIEITPLMTWGAGFFVVLGHCYSPWLHLKGGKGVATSLGVALILSPVSALFGVAAFILTFLNGRIVSLSNIAGLITAAIAYLVLNPMGIHLWVGAAMIFLVLIRHEVNIDALLENKEQPFS